MMFSHMAVLFWLVLVVGAAKVDRQWASVHNIGPNLTTGQVIDNTERDSLQTAEPSPGSGTPGNISEPDIPEPCLDESEIVQESLEHERILILSLQRKLKESREKRRVVERTAANVDTVLEELLSACSDLNSYTSSLRAIDAQLRTDLPPTERLELEETQKQARKAHKDALESKELATVKHQREQTKLDAARADFEDMTEDTVFFEKVIDEAGMGVRHSQRQLKSCLESV